MNRKISLESCYSFGLSLRKGKKQYLLEGLSEEQFAKLYTQLRKSCIQVDLAKKYRVVEKVGEGAFAEVYRGLNKHKMNTVAVKRILKPALSRNPAFAVSAFDKRVEFHPKRN